MQLVLQAGQLAVRLQDRGAGLRVDLDGALHGVARAVAGGFHVFHALREDPLVLRLLRLARVAVDLLDALLQVAGRGVVILDRLREMVRLGAGAAGLVEVAGVEPASASLPQSGLHA